MSRTVLAAILGLTLAGPAFAQSTDRPPVATTALIPPSAAASTATGQSSSASQTLNPTTANGAPPVPEQAATGSQTPASATVTHPEGWTGTPQAWDAHVKACAKRYKSYDAATDMYAAGRGKTAKCMTR